MPRAAVADSGQLTHGDCLTSKTSVAGCSAITGATAGTTAPLSNLYGLAVSPDGYNVYAASGVGAAVVTFTRTPVGGALTFTGAGPPRRVP